MLFRSCTSAFGDHDVLRGEELTAAAVIRPGRLGGAMLLSVPGMHGKWIELSETRIEGFHTSMTVELFRLLADRSILAPLTKAVPSNNDAFQRGVTRAAEGGGIGRLLFSARSAVLAGTMREADAASYIWGVLIGADIRENLPRIRSGELACLVTGADDVAPLFCAALETMGAKADLLDNRRLSAVGFARLRQAVDLAREAS